MEILNFVYLYPFVMSILWITLGLRFYMTYTKFDDKNDGNVYLKDFPFVSILVPCYNE